MGYWLDEGPVLINPIVYAEFVSTYDIIEAVDDLSNPATSTPIAQTALELFTGPGQARIMINLLCSDVVVSST